MGPNPAPTVARQQLLFAFPQYGSGTQMTDVPIGRQRYDSAQMKLTRRFSKGLSLTLAYTIAKTLERWDAGYVGMTKGSFRQECFQPTKINHYNDALGRFSKAHPVLFLLPKLTASGKAFAKPVTSRARMS